MAKRDEPYPPAPWWQILSGLLLVSGVALVLATIAMRGLPVQTSSVVETTRSSATPAAQPSVATSTAVPTTPAETTKTTVTTSGLSDSVVIALSGLGVVLIAAGGLYTRLSKISIAGNTLELGAPTPEQVQQAANAVTRSAQQNPAVASLAPEQKAAAVYQIAFEVAKLSSAAQSAPTTEVPKLAELAAPSAQDVDGLKSGNPSTQYWDRLARAALSKASTTQTSPPTG